MVRQLFNAPANEWIAKVSRAYLGVFLMGIPLGILGNSLYPGVAIIKGQALAVVAPMVCAALGTFLWLFYRPVTRLNPWARVFLIILTVIWTCVFTLDYRDGQAFNYTTFLVPLLCVLLFMKPVGAQDATMAGLMLAWTTIAISLVWLIQQAAEGELGSSATFGIRLPGLATPLGAGGRWQGPFESPNYAGPAAAFALIFSLSQRSWSRAALLTFSAVLVIASGSRSALLGAFVGVVVYFAGKSMWVRGSSSWFRIGGITGAAAALVLLLVVTDPTLNGRTPIWPAYIDWWRASPWTGSGTSAISDAVSSGGVPGSFIHAHNVWIDVLARYGIAVFLLTAVLAAVALAAGLATARCGRTFPLALSAAFVVIGLAEVHGSWMYLSIPIAWLLVSVVSETGAR